MLIINNQQTLNEFCIQLSYANIISVDTEFTRRTTYYAKLSIIQVRAAKYQVIIDVLSGLDLTPLNEIFLNEKILKIFHAPREDFEIFYNLFKQLPQNIFDIQIAMQVCGLGSNLSYSNICYQLCGIKIDKTHQKSNWLARPICTNMLDYALKDVEYLEPIYKILQDILYKNQLDEEYQRQIKKLLNIENYKVNFQKAWQKVKLSNNNCLIFIPKIQILAAYREEIASQIDLPRQHFISDEDLIMLCKYLPINNKEIDDLQLNSRYLSKQKYRNQLFDLCRGIREEG